MNQVRFSNYSIEKPGWGFQLWLGLVVLGLGQVGVLIAAFTAFNLVMAWYQAFFFAALIEIAAVWEAIELILQSKRRFIAFVGLVITLTVSFTYNYIQVEHAGKVAGITGGWQLLTLAAGPVSALVFVSLKFGSALEEHQDGVRAWEAARQAWFDGERDLERKSREKLERARIRAEVRIAEARQGAGGGKLPESGNSDRKDSGDWDELPEAVRHAYPRETDFGGMKYVRHFSVEQLAALHGMAGPEITRIFIGMLPRTARLFAADYVPGAMAKLAERNGGMRGVVSAGGDSSASGQ